ncbi:MAG: GlxA family transcriptional regulator [Caulobacteraceae bacterium]|nr:GlxA family transcriptional regulator [Caulobacteraceae bacterium]
MPPAYLGRFGFLTLPNYSMIACANAIEPLRMANRLTGRPDYEWRILSLDGQPISASNGLTLGPTAALEAREPLDAIFVCGGVDVRLSVGRPLKAALRRLARGGMTLGALCTGTFALAEAGLLNGRRCAVHWEDLDAIREEFPDIEFVQDLYAIDGDRLTCTGGVAPLDMMLHLIGARFGRDLAGRISQQFILDRSRAGEERQPSRAAAEAVAGHPALARAVRLMEERIEDPLPAARLAEFAGVSARQLERLFKERLGQTPGAFALSLRLDRARALLRQTALPITDVALASGFNSPTHFSSAYRRRFGRSPRAERS